MTTTIYKNRWITNRKRYKELYLIGGSIREDFKNGVYDIIIGSGGFGRVFGSTKPNYQHEVVKLLYAGKCGDARKEYNIHNACYLALEKFKTIYSMSQVNIVKPIEYTTNSIFFADINYDCGYKMERITSINKLNNKFDDVLYHIILKEQYDNSSNFNKQAGRIFYSEINKENPSRGFFATPSYIKKQILDVLNDDMKENIQTLNDIASRYGYLLAVIIFVANYVPIDAEYTFSSKNSKLYITLLDFGMFTPIDFKYKLDDKPINEDTKTFAKDRYYNKIAQEIVYDIWEVDLYFPVKTDTTYNSFINTFKETAPKCIDINSSDIEIMNNMSSLYEKILLEFEKD